MLQQQVSSLLASERHGAPTPNLGEAQRVKGGRQRLTQERVPELLDATRKLDKIELVATQQADRQIRDELRALVLEEPHTAPPSSQHGPTLGSRTSPSLSTLTESVGEYNSDSRPNSEEGDESPTLPTIRPAGARPEDFSRSCAAPTPITPGRVQPWKATGRSIAPVARTSFL